MVHQTLAARMRLNSSRDGNDRVLIYRRNFLPISETFISDHILQLRRWSPVPVCDARTERGLEVPGFSAQTIYASGSGRREHWAMKILGVNPRLAAISAAYGVRLIHAHFIPDAIRMIRFSVHAGLPLVVTAHGYDATTNVRHLSRGERLVDLVSQHYFQKHVAAVICVSDFIRNELTARGFPPEKLRTLPLGVDLSALQAPKPAQPRSGVLFVGRLVEKKGAQYLIEAWARLPDGLRNTPLTLIGDGPLRSSLTQLAQSLGVPARFLGAQPRTVVLEQMSQASVLACPSTRAADGDAEGLPIVLMEAQALGMPIVAFDSGPASEAIAGDRSGLLARDKNAEDFSLQLSRLLGDAALRERLGCEGPIVARERFDIKVNIARLEQLYDELAFN